MGDEEKTREQLVEELLDLRQRIDQLEKTEAERTLTQDVLRESEEHSRRMLNAITTYTYSVEVRDGRAVSTSHSSACLSITGYSEDDYQRDPFLWYSMIHPSDRKMVEDAVSKILEGQAVPPVEHRIIRRDGATVWIRNTMVAHHDQEGNLIHYDGLVEDINARKQMEAHILWGQKMESLGRMAGAVAHNFNNILAAIYGYSELIQSELPSESPVQSMVNQIISACKRAQNITAQIVAYTGHMLLSLGPLDLSMLITGMAPLIEAGLSGKIVIHYNLPTDLPKINADSSQIRQVVINLITNAMEAIGDNSGSVTVSTGVTEAGINISTEPYLAGTRDKGPYVMLEIRDNGCGMDENTVVRIFDPFFSTKFLGRGLGLPAVLGIVRRHQGFIRVLSELGSGTTMLVGFPVLGDHHA
jgi:two-component system, cell cycle sensor histidine kinase and response regulator CckA